MDEDVLLPLIDDMLHERQIGLEKVNAMFGTNITVKLSSSCFEFTIFLISFTNKLKKISIGYKT